MTRFDTDLASRGWALISEGAQMISLAYAANESGVAAVPAAAPAGPVTFDDDPPLKPQVERGLGMCSTHGTAWTIKAGGISRNGKPYPAFWRCNEKDGEEYCKERPQPIWAKTHSAEAVA